MDKPDYIIHKKGCGRIFPLGGICTCGAYDPVELEKEEVIPATCERCLERPVYVSKRVTATLCGYCIVDNMVRLGVFARKYASPECECNPVGGIHAAFCPRDGIEERLTKRALDGGGLCACEEMSEHSVVAGVCVYCNRPRQ